MEELVFFLIHWDISIFPKSQNFALESKYALTTIMGRNLAKGNILIK